MKNKRGFTLYEIMLIILIGICVAFGVFYFYALIKYANTPVSEMPVWVWWMLQSGGSN